VEVRHSSRRTARHAPARTSPRNRCNGGWNHEDRRTERPAESHVWETGKAYWLPANPPNTMHADVNAGDKPIEVVVVELKKEN
jgi:hypothetical protein